MLERAELRSEIVDGRRHYQRARRRVGPPPTPPDYERPPGGDVVVEPPEGEQWVEGLLKMFLHMRSQGVTWELEIELDGLSAPEWITTQRGRALRKRLMSEVVSTVEAKDAHFGQFIAMMQFADRPTAIQAATTIAPLPAVSWERTIVRNLSLKQVKQWEYDGGAVDL